jgi:hypothetical protein
MGRIVGNTDLMDVLFSGSDIPVKESLIKKPADIL